MGDAGIYFAEFYPVDLAVFESTIQCQLFLGYPFAEPDLTNSSPESFNSFLIPVIVFHITKRGEKRFFN